jgi:predicted nucleotidyltransferase
LSSLSKVKLELRRIAENYTAWGKKILSAAQRILGPCEAYVFGSYSKGSATGASDVDILIVCGSLPSDCRSRGNIKARLEEDAKLPLYHPFEIHLATEEEARRNPIYLSAIREGIPIHTEKKR